MLLECINAHVLILICGVMKNLHPYIFLPQNNHHDFLVLFVISYIKCQSSWSFASSILCFGAGVMYAHIYMDCLRCTIFSVTMMLLPIMFFILLYMVLYKHISYHKIPFCISIRNKCLVSFSLEFF